MAANQVSINNIDLMISLYVDQLSVSETAAKLGVEKNTVSTHRRNACEKIRKEMESCKQKSIAEMKKVPQNLRS